MLKRISIIVFLAFFILVSAMAMAEDKAKPHKNNYPQNLYNWFGTLDKICVTQSERYCKACEKQCCKDCNMDCGGTCCANCKKSDD